MKTRNICKGIALLAMALTTAACQNELNEDTNQPQPSEKATMTIHATQGTAPQTRTTYDDQLDATTINKVVVKWEGGTAAGALQEEIYVFGYSSDNDGLKNPETFTSKLATLNNNGSSIDFEGTEPAGTYKAAIYPANEDFLDDLTGSLYFDLTGQTQDCTPGNEMSHLKAYDIMLGTPATGTNNYSFSHQTIMLRFKLKFDKEESVTGVTLGTSVADGIASLMTTLIGTNKVDFRKNFDANSLSLAVTNHTTASKELKAYMMVGDIDISNGATLTVTVNTVSGNTYTGDLAVAASDTPLTPGLCYTLTPKLTLSNTINISSITQGGLEAALEKVTPATNQTELALKGEIGSNDIFKLPAFLKGNKGTNITTLDLSGLTYPDATVDGFLNCDKLVSVILPTNATVIGDNAFNGCKALTTITQYDEPTHAATRAIISGRIKTIGNNAFQYCTAMEDMFLHGDITKVGNTVFKGCTALKALVFEGSKAVGDGGITLGTGIVDGCPDVVILLPYIKTADAAKPYKTALGKDTYYEYNKGTYLNALTEDKKDVDNYTKITDGDKGNVDDLTPGGDWGGSTPQQ